MAYKADATVTANVDVGGTDRSALYYDSITHLWRTKNQAAVDEALVNGASSVSNSDGTLTISPTTGAVVASRPAITGDVSIPVASNTSTLANTGPGATGPIGSTSVTPVVTIDAKGRVTALSSATITPTAIGAVPTTRTITATAPITIDGTTSADLSANRTIAIAASSATVPGSQSASSFRKQRDQYTDIVNDLGADPTGATDATAIITAWLATITNSAVLFIPASVRIRVDGPVTVNKEIRVIGAERRTSIIGTGSATNNQFNVTADSCIFENLRFEVGTTAQNLALKSAGYAIEIQSTSNGSGCYKCDFIGQWSAINLEACQLPIIEDCNIREYGAITPTGGSCIRVNTASAGGDAIIRRVLTDNGSNPTGYAGIRVVNCASLIIEACNIIHATVNLAITPPNAGTVPSLKVTNSFFDNGTHGLQFSPTGTGVWYRSEFVNCWFGSNTTAGVAFASPQFDGIVFTNCDILGNPVGIDANAGGGSWTLNGGCQIAGSSTAGIRLAASAGHFPVIQGNRIRPQAVGGAFGVNAVGIIIGAGTYLGLIIAANDVSGNTSAGTFGAVTVGTWAQYRITDNAGINPKTVTTPAVPATGVAATNTTGQYVVIGYKTTGTIHTAFNLNGQAFAAPNLQPINSLSYISLPPGGTITWTGGTAPTWVWVGQ